jgi:quinol monooxygenase YgiN
MSRVLEIGILPIKPEKTDRIEQLGREIADYRSRPENRPVGWHSFRLHRAIEDPNRFVLHLTWDSVADHKRSSESEWGKKVAATLGECLASDATVHHYQLVEGCGVGTPDLSKVLQIAILPIKPEKTDALEQLGREIVEFRSKPENQANESNGWHSTRLYRSIEDPNRYVIHGTWNAAEDHARSGGGERGKRIVGILSECLSGETIVHHYNLVEGSSAGDDEL